MVLIKVKSPTEFTGPESYVASLIKDRDNDWFPRMRAMSLDMDDGNEGSDSSNLCEMKVLQISLEATQRLVATLSHQLAELRDQVSILEVD